MNMLEENISLENAYPNDAYLAVDVLNQMDKTFDNNFKSILAIIEDEIKKEIQNEKNTRR